MGMWFFASAAGNYVASLIAKGTAGDPVLKIAERIYFQVMNLPEIHLQLIRKMDLWMFTRM